ncbi:MAG: InlB B-repeat-containing protein, partial [Clostridia bacterium]|nr:InlB B-repeat-containing protein [Clostridia bacterium]
MQEEKETLGEDFPVSEEREKAVGVAEEASAPSSGEANGEIPKKKSGKKRRKLIALICATLAVLAAVATVLGVLLHGRSGDKSPVFFTIEFLGLEQEVSITGEAGAAYTPPQTQRDGYEFDGWYADAEYAEQVDLPAVIPAENMRFYARYAKVYTVNFWDGATLLASYTGKAGTAISVPETDKASFECEGWFVDAQCTQEAQAPLTIPEGGGNYYVKYAELFTVTFMDGESELSRFVGKLGTPIQIDQPKKDGFAFEGWSDGTQAVEVPVQIEGNAVFYAQFSKLYTVIFWDGEAELSRITGKAGDAVQVPQPQKDGFAFHGWCGANGEAVTPSATIQADANYYTIFAKLYSVEFRIEGERVHSFQTEAGEKIAAPTAPSKAGYTFVGWFEEADGEQKVLSFPLIAATKDVVYVAFYGENPTLTFYVNAPLGAQANGETRVLEGEYGKENSVTAGNAFAVTGYEFAGWAESADGRVIHKDGAEILFSEHKELFAQWARAYTNGNGAAVIYYTALADGYPVYAAAGNRISGEISTSPLGDAEYRFAAEGLNGRLNADGTYEPRGTESGWYALADGKAYLGGYGEAAFECGAQSERGAYRIEMANLLYYEGEEYTGTYRFDRTAWEMNFVDNRAAYGNYYGERMSALILGAQAELGDAKGVYVAVGENIYFYFNGVETQGKFYGTHVEYGGHHYERLEGELTLYGEAGEELRFTPSGSAYESAAQWLANGEALDGTVVGGDKLIFRGGNENYIFEWELETLLSVRSVRVAEKRERIRYINADEFAQY